MEPDYNDQDPYREIFRVRKALGALFLALFLGLAFWFFSGEEADAEDISFFQIGTGPGGGTKFPIGSTLANAISSPPGSPPCNLGGSCGVPGLVGTAQITDGSEVNVRALRDGTYQSAIVEADTAFLALAGLDPFTDDGPFEGLRAITSLHVDALHIVVPGDSDITSISDLDGAAISIGSQGGSPLNVSRLLLNAYGLSLEDDQLTVLAPNQAADEMLAGNVDAMIVMGGVPIPAIEDMGRRMALRLLPIEAGPHHHC